MRRPLHERLFAAVAVLLPDDFRQTFGADLATTFAERARDARTRGRLRYSIWLVREFVGLVQLTITEHVDARLNGASRIRTPERKALSPMEHFAREIRHAARRLLRTPGFTIASVFTLALAIGANTAIVALLHRIVLSPLPYPTPDRLIEIDHSAPGVGLPSGLGTTSGLYGVYGTLPSVEAIGLYTGGENTLTGTGNAERLESLVASPSLGGILGATPIAGRWFTDAEGKEGAPRVAVLSHSLWVRRFGASPNVVESTIHLDGDAYQVVGVMPPSFAFPDEHTQVILPLQLGDLSRLGGFNYRSLARLRPGATIDELKRQQDAVIADLPARFPANPEQTKAMIGDVKLSAIPISLTDSVLGNTTQTLWLLLAAVGIVLLIACANLANLFLVRTDGRQQEVAVRQALGAAPGKVAAFFLGEAMLVALASGALGLLLADLALRVLVAKAPIALPRLHEVQIDLTVVSFTILASIIAGLGFGLMPLMRRLPAVASVLQDAARGNSAGGRRMRTRQVLMASQVSLAVVLLVSAGLMIESFYRLQRVDPGFATESRLIFSMGLSRTDYPSDEAAVAFHESFLGRLRGIPGVKTSGLTTALPLDREGSGDPLEVAGRPPGWNKVGAVVRFRQVSEDYFVALGMKLRRGRFLDATDRTGTSNAVVVDDEVVRLYFPGEDPIGKRVRPIGRPAGEGWFEIVGVVGNTVTHTLQEASPIGKMYLAPRSHDVGGIGSTHRSTYVLHVNGSPTAFISPVRRLLAELNPNVAMTRPEALADLVARAGSGLAFTMVLLVVAASVALVLGLVGVYAVIAYGVAQRTNEIGVRLALGAQPGDVTGMIVRQSGGVVALGVVIGVGGAIAGARVLQSLLFGVAWNNPVTYGTVAIGLFGVALLACWLPARRAGGLDPTVALRR